MKYVQEYSESDSIIETRTVNNEFTETFLFEEKEDWKKQEKLKYELESTGFYISGHPLDDYRSIINKVVTMTSENLKYAEKNKYYTMLGTIRHLQQEVTDKSMACLEDMTGITIIFFSADAWALLSKDIHNNKVVSLSGTFFEVDHTTIFNVREMNDLEELKTKILTEVHIQLSKNYSLITEKNLDDLQKNLLHRKGCNTLAIHIYNIGNNYVLKSLDIKIPADDSFLQILKELPILEKVWLE